MPEICLVAVEWRWVGGASLKLFQGRERTSLADKVDGSVANPAVRRAELMNRMRGFEDMADPVGNYVKMLKQVDPSAWEKLFGEGLQR